MTARVVSHSWPLSSGRPPCALHFQLRSAHDKAAIDISRVQSHRRHHVGHGVNICRVANEGERMTRNPILRKLPEYEERVFTVADPTWQWASSIGLAIAVGIVYFLAARFSLSLLTKPDGVAVFWPASGVAAGVLISLGHRAKWPVAIGAAAATIAANLLGDRSFAGAFTFALCNAGEAMLAAGLIERQFGSGFTLYGVRQV